MPKPVNHTLSFKQARRCIEIGKLVKRALWDNWLTVGVHGNLEFVKSVHLYGKTRDRSYAPTAIDMLARDWEWQ